MAKIVIDNILTLGEVTPESHEWTSWEIYKDAEMTDLLDSKYKSTTDLLEWTTPLILEDNGNEEDNVYYMGDTFLYGRVKIKWEGKETVWINTNPCGINGPQDCIGFKLIFPTPLPCRKYDRWDDLDYRFGVDPIEDNLGLTFSDRVIKDVVTW